MGISKKEALQAIERELGRDREAEQSLKQRTGARYTSRPIDIDILFYDDRVIRTERLTVPHPLIQEREFVLVPLCEWMRDYRHPVLGKTVGELRCAAQHSGSYPAAHLRGGNGSLRAALQCAGKCAPGLQQDESGEWPCIH